MKDDYKHRGLRKALVKTLKKKGINNDEILAAIGKVPRHFFFDQAFLEHAYQDKAFPIGEGQTITQPYTVAFQTHLLEPSEGHKVLEIGTGSGYQACILCELGVNLFTIEYLRPLYDKARKFLPAMGYSPHFKQGDGSKGWLSQAPFDRILVTAGAPGIPQSLVDQLKPGGIMVIPVGNDKQQQMLRVVKDLDGKIKKKAYDYFSFVPLVGKEGWNV